MDVKATFLNGMTEEEVYIEKLEGFETCYHSKISLEVIRRKKMTKVTTNQLWSIGSSQPMPQRGLSLYGIAFFVGISG